MIVLIVFLCFIHGIMPALDRLLVFIPLGFTLLLKIPFTAQVSWFLRAVLAFLSVFIQL